MQSKPENNINLSETSLNKNSSFFSILHVDIKRNAALKERLRVLIHRIGLTETKFYKSLGLGRDYWYRISWGRQNCPLDLRVRIAQALSVDSSVIWLPKEDKNV